MTIRSMKISTDTEAKMNENELEAGAVEVQFGAQSPEPTASNNVRAFKLDTGSNNFTPYKSNLAEKLAALDEQTEQGKTARRKEIEAEEEKAKWEHFLAWLKERTTPFEAFFNNPVANFTRIGLVLNDGETAETAFANYQLQLKVGEDTLDIEQRKITVTTNEEGIPEQAILTALAFALKNGKLKSEGVKITSPDEDLKVFTYLAFQKAGFKILNKEEFENEDGSLKADLDQGAQEAWAKLLENEQLKASLTNAQPELAAVFNKQAAAEPAPTGEATAALAATAAAAASASDSTSVKPLNEALIGTPEYDVTTDEAFAPFTANDTAYPSNLGTEDLAKLKNAQDILSLSSADRFFGKDVRELGTIGQKVIRALTAMIHHSDTPEAFATYLHEKTGVTQARAKELADNLQASVKAKTANLPKTKIEVKNKNTNKFEPVEAIDMSKIADNPELVKTVIILVESQHQNNGAKNEHYQDVREKIESVLKGGGKNPQKFFKWLTQEFTSKSPFDQVGSILKNMDYENPRDPKAKNFIDYPHEGHEMLLAAYRALVFPITSVTSAPIIEKLDKPYQRPFPVNDNNLQLGPNLLPNAIGCQYAALLVRSMMNAENANELTRPLSNKLSGLSNGLALITAIEGKKILKEELEHRKTVEGGANDKVIDGLNSTIADLDKIETVAQDRLAAMAEQYRPWLNKIRAESTDDFKAAKASVILGIEQLYAEIVQTVEFNGKKIPEDVVRANVQHFAKFRQYTEVKDIAPNFADSPDYAFATAEIEKIKAETTKDSSGPKATTTAQARPTPP